MSDFLDNLAARNVARSGGGPTDIVRPRLTSLFEPIPADPSPEFQATSPASAEGMGRPDVRSLLSSETSSSEEGSVETERARAPRAEITTKTGSRSAVSAHESAPEADLASTVVSSVQGDPLRAEEGASTHLPEAAARSGEKRNDSVATQARVNVSQLLLGETPTSPRRSAEGSARESRSTTVRALPVTVEPEISRVTGDRGSPDATTAAAVENRIVDSLHSPLRVHPGASFLTPVNTIRHEAPPAIGTGEDDLKTRGSTRRGPDTSGPVIKVSIGRVDVRAEMAPQPPQRQAPAPRKPPLSLDEYLKQRSGGRR